jgi:hypothetical protein
MPTFDQTCQQQFCIYCSRYLVQVMFFLGAVPWMPVLSHLITVSCIQNVNIQVSFNLYVSGMCAIIYLSVVHLTTLHLTAGKLQFYVLESTYTYVAFPSCTPRRFLNIHTFLVGLSPSSSMDTS